MPMIISKTRQMIADRSGDTIIEVMVVLAVLGLAIGISYATANRSLLNARQAQENSQAAGLVKTQVENLRLLAANSTPGNTNPNTNIFLPSVPYCVPDPSSATPIDTNTAHCMYPPVPYQILIYNCDSLGASGPCANVSNPTTSDTLVVQATWPDILGQGTDSVTVDYRLHAP